MLFCLHIQDKPDRVETRKQFVDEHRAYQKDCGVDVTLSGPLLAEDGKTMVGSIFFIGAPDRVGSRNSSPTIRSLGTMSGVNLS